MRAYSILFGCWLIMTQPQDSNVIPSVAILEIEEGAITPLHLSPGYTTSVKLPEEISSVVIGDPASFKAEHSEAEPRLVFFKPIVTQAVESNALVTTRSGQEITLHLVSAGKATTRTRVDFLVEYHRPRSLIVGPSDPQRFLIAETHSIPPIASGSPPARTDKPDPVAQELETQKNMSTPAWKGKEVLAAVGASVMFDHRTILGFSILNNSARTIELLPPQVELSSHGQGNGSKRIKAEPVPVLDYRMTTRRLAPGERADGVVVFTRPTFKESSEELQLQLAQAEQVDRPIVLPVPFTATNSGGPQ